VASRRCTYNAFPEANPAERYSRNRSLCRPQDALAATPSIEIREPATHRSPTHRKGRPGRGHSRQSSATGSPLVGSHQASALLSLQMKAPHVCPRAICVIVKAIAATVQLVPIVPMRVEAAGGVADTTGLGRTRGASKPP